MPDEPHVPDESPRDSEPATRLPPTTSYHLPPKDYPTTGRETLVTIRYGKMQSRGRFRSKTSGLIYSDKVVVQSDRGIELGEIVFNAPTGAEARADAMGWVVRRATDDDVDSHVDANERFEGPTPEYAFCRERIEALELPMRLVDVERPYGGGKIIFYFTAEGRVDFRALVRDLAKRFRTRIEMKQIGVRDEAKVLGDVGDCGRELCCRTFLTRMQPISMRMAKVQKTTLDPAKISGRCGRLKCCLRYEYDAYLSLRESLPRPGARVAHGSQTATVVSMDVLSQMVTVVLEGGERTVVHVDELAPIGRRVDAAPQEPPVDPPSGAEAPDVAGSGGKRKRRKRRRPPRGPDGDAEKS